jgi:hypothetical protein
MLLVQLFLLANPSTSSGSSSHFFFASWLLQYIQLLHVLSVVLSLAQLKYSSFGLLTVRCLWTSGISLTCS